MIDLNTEELKNVNKLKEILVKEGIFKVSSFLNANELTALKKEVLGYHKTYGDQYQLISQSLYQRKEKKKMFFISLG